jgi:hypothetical protein
MQKIQREGVGVIKILFVISWAFVLGQRALEAFHIDAHIVDKPLAWIKKVTGMQKEKKAVRSTEAVAQFFKAERFYLKDVRIVTDPLALQAVARDALKYIHNHKLCRQDVINPTTFQGLLSLEAVERTLAFVSATIEADKKSGNFRILNQNFLNKYFKSIAWVADAEGAKSHNIKLPDDGSIRLTKYAVFRVRASHKKTKQFSCALYSLSNDAVIHNISKQSIIDGYLDQPQFRRKRKVLAWVTREGLEDALMQGTAIVTFGDGKEMIVSVDKNNNIPYKRREKNVLAQKRYWSFKKLQGTASSIKAKIKKIQNRRNVMLAGDLHHIGIGKLIALDVINPVSKKRELRLGIIADTGGAFFNNLYQLDYFVGAVSSREALAAAMKPIPNCAHASILYKHVD